MADIVAEDDEVDAVVDGWTCCLTVEDQPVFFEDLLLEDIEMRTVVEEEEDEEEPAVGETSHAPSGEVLGLREFQEVMLAEFNALNQMVDESRELMVAGFKETKEEMKSLDDRVTRVEAFVKEVRMDGDLANVINLSQAQGRYDPVPHDPVSHDPLVDSFNLLTTVASKVTEKKVEEEEEEGQVGKGVEEDKEKDVSGEQVIVEEGEQVLEEDKRENKKKKKSGKNQRKKMEKKEAERNKSTHVEEEQVEKAQEQEVQEEVEEKQAEATEEVKGNKKKRKTHSDVLKPPFHRPNTRQRTTTDGTMD